MADLRLASDVTVLGNQLDGLVAGEDLEPGLVALDGSGDVVMANAGTNYDQTGPAIGFCAYDVDDGAAVTVFREGLITDATGLTAGEAVYLSGTSDGDVAASAPAVSGDIQQVVGQAISTTKFMLDIDSVYATAGE